jgi:hypothetical protein
VHPARFAIRAEEVDGIRPTKEELRELARYWAGVILDYQYGTCSNPMLPRDQWLPWACASMRLDDIRKVIGEDAVREVVGEVEDRMRRRMGDTRWRVFRGDTQGEGLDLGEELNAEMDYAFAKSEDLPLVQKALSYLSANPQRVFFDEDGDLWFLAEVDERNAGKRDVLNLVLLTWRGYRTALWQTVPKPCDWFPPYRLHW